MFSEDDAQPFYDETLWHMRDKSKDYNAFYPEDAYYGVKGVKRVSNKFGLIGCVLIMVIGMCGFYVALRFVLATSSGTRVVTPHLLMTCGLVLHLEALDT